MEDKTYGTLVTDCGIQLIAAAVMEGKKINITDLAVGDGGGAYYQPTPNMTGLKNECWSGPIKSVSVNKDSPNSNHSVNCRRLHDSGNGRQR